MQAPDPDRGENLSSRAPVTGPQLPGALARMNNPRGKGHRAGAAAAPVFIRDIDVLANKFKLLCSDEHRYNSKVRSPELISEDSMWCTEAF